MRILVRVRPTSAKSSYNIKVADKCFSVRPHPQLYPFLLSRAFIALHLFDGA